MEGIPMNTEEVVKCGSDYIDHPSEIPNALVLVHLGLQDTLTPLCLDCLRDLAKNPRFWNIVEPTERNIHLING